MASLIAAKKRDFQKVKLLNILMHSTGQKLKLKLSSNVAETGPYKVK